MAPIQYVRATTDDVDAYLRIEKSVASPFILVTTNRKEATTEIHNSVTYMIRSGSKTIGLVSYKKERNSTVGHISEIAIRPSHQGKGIGGLVLSKIVEELRLKGCMSVDLETHPKNPAARLYKRHGFVVTGRIENYLGSNTPRLVLTKQLRPLGIIYDVHALKGASRPRPEQD